MNNCPDCGTSVERGDLETDKYNMETHVTYYCGNCMQAWIVIWDEFNQTETIKRHNDD